MRLRISALIATTLAAAFFCFPAVGQSASDWDQLRRVKAGSRVIVDLQDGQSLRGKIRGVAADRLDLSTGGNSIAVAKADIKSVHRAKRGSIAGRVLIGAAAGAGIGLAVAVPIAAATKEPLTGAAGILLGVPAGAVIASATRGKATRGELIYFAP